MGWFRRRVSSIEVEERLLLLWLALTLFAHREAILFQLPSAITDPVEGFFFEASYSTPRLLYGLFLLTLFGRRHAIANALGGPTRPILGGVLLAAGISLFVWATSIAQHDLLMDAFVLVCLGGAFVAGGTAMAEIVLLPLAFVWLARPLPPALVHHVHDVLQAGAASFAQLVLSPFDPVLRSGDLLAFRSATFRVVENCSGFRIIVALTMAALVYADASSRSRIQTFGLLVCAPLIGFVANGLRVVWIMIYPTSEVSAVHATQGVVMICVGVVVLAGFDLLGNRLLWPKGSRSWRNRSSVAARAGPGPVRRLAPGIAAVSLLAAVSLVPPSIELPAPDPWRLERIPRDLDAWRSTPFELDPAFLGSVGFRDKIPRNYERDTERVQLLLTAEDRRRRDRSGYSPKTQLLGSGWERVSVERIALRGWPVPVERLVEARPGEKRQLVYHLRLGARPLVWESLAWLLALDFRPGSPPGEILTLRVSTDYDSGDPAIADRRLQGFLEALTPHLRGAAPAGMAWSPRVTRSRGLPRRPAASAAPPS